MTELKVEKVGFVGQVDHCLVKSYFQLVSGEVVRIMAVLPQSHRFSGATGFDVFAVDETGKAGFYDGEKLAKMVCGFKNLNPVWEM
jgi:hypothetical protein